MKRSAPMKRTPFKRKPAPYPLAALEEALPTVHVPRPVVRPRVRMASNLGAEPPRPDPVAETFRSEAWLAAVRSIPCVHCGAPLVQAAHANRDKGMGQKVDDCLTAAICPPIHAEIDQGKNLSRDERRARMDRYIVLTVRELARRGLLTVRKP